MRKKIIICVIGFVLVLFSVFEYSNYANAICNPGGRLGVGGDGTTDEGELEFSDNMRFLQLSINPICGEDLPNAEGSLGGKNGRFKNLPDKGSVIVKIVDEEGNVYKSYTVKSGADWSKTIIVGKGEYHMELETVGGFTGAVKHSSRLWKLI